LLFENERIVGVRATTPQGELEVRADLVVGADGRSSTVRERADLEVIDLGAPIDVLWFGLSKRAGDPEQAFGYVGVGQFMVLLDRGDYLAIHARTVRIAKHPCSPTGTVPAYQMLPQ
jgi:2-polyprenyl-6-methoxyphenol hydroxylase-like FAD-dependent oxidoreductase